MDQLKALWHYLWTIVKPLGRLIIEAFLLSGTAVVLIRIYDIADRLSPNPTPGSIEFQLITSAKNLFAVAEIAGFILVTILLVTMSTVHTLIDLEQALDEFRTWREQQRNRPKGGGA